MNNSLSEIEFKISYRTVKDNIITDFYMPAFECASNYDRAVGFFNSDVFKYIFSSSKKFIENGGRIRLIIGCSLREDEFRAIEIGEKNKNSIDKDLFIKSCWEKFEEDKQSADLLSYLIANNQLDIKFAITNIDNSMLHVKMGIFTDKSGNKVAFTGSANETFNGTSNNIETIQVYRSYVDSDIERVEDNEREFNDYWENNYDNKVIVLPLSESVEDFLKSKAPSNIPEGVFTNNKKNSDFFEQHQKQEEENSIKKDDIDEPHIPSKVNEKKFELRKHQENALQAWKNNNYKGILELATGSGKTITSIYQAVKLYEEGLINCLVVVVPLKHLAKQWCEELEKFGFSPLECNSDNSRWKDEASSQLLDLGLKTKKIVAFVVVTATYKLAPFKSVMEKIQEQWNDKLFFIGDECHGHSGEDFIPLIPDCNYKMGLSATPKHYRRSSANERLFKVYGNPDSDNILEPIAKYTIEDALSDGILTQYYYYPILVDLTEDEHFVYKKCKSVIAQCLNKKGGMQSEEAKKAMVTISKITGNAEDKIVKFTKLINYSEPWNKVIDKQHCLVYSGKGKSNYDGEKKQISDINKIMEKKHWAASQIISGVSAQDRNYIIKDFALGTINALLAIKCLDEGVDIPACKTAIITASSNDPREFIQRRGRILRSYPGKEYATIYDFVVRNPYEENPDEKSPSLIRKELSRVYEFASFSINEADSKKLFEDTGILKSLKKEGVEEWGESCRYKFSDYEEEYESEEEDEG